VIAQIRKCTRAVVTEGTAKGIESPFYTISGKTGTAQVADKGISYTDGVYQGSFVGYLPADQPKYTICVVIRTKPHSVAYYGGAIAAPVFRMVADKIFSENIGAWGGPLDSLARNNTGALAAKPATNRSYQTLFHAIQKRLPLPAEEKGRMMEVRTDSNKIATVVPKEMYRNVMPDLKGMGLKDAVYILETEGLQVQSIAPGTIINKGQNIILQLS
jgi:cell division protein FtsI (penicillin-binding protein 3)